MANVKEKLMIVGMGNWGNENFIRIKARKKSLEIPKLIDSFLLKLGFHSHFNEKEYCRKDNWIATAARYKDNIGIHEFFQNRKYKLHVIFDEKYLYLIIKTTLKNRNEMVKRLMLYCKWVKPKKQKKRKK